MLFSVQSANKEHPPFPETAATSQVTDVQKSHFLYGDE